MSKIVCLCFLALFGLGAFAQVPFEQVRQLSRDPTWHGLLQIQGGQKTGEEGFYWASLSDTSEQELLRSLAAIQDPAQRAVFACRFPARFYFISHRLGLSGAREQLRQCDQLVASIEIDRIEGISLVLVGSYLSNPASSFGHTLLRLHQRSAQGTERDLSFNYGALIPANEPVLSYIFKGIFGRYRSSYSDQDPFVHDITYNHLENRDSWSYAINHSVEDRLLIALHLWEMAGAKFQYFFFSRNCAWQMGQSLKLSLDEKEVSTEPIPYWTLPVEVVHDLQDQGLVKQVTHTASHQRRLNAALQRLNAADAARFSQLVDKGWDVDPQTDSVPLTNAVIDYYTWRNASNSINEDTERRFVSLREQAVLARLQQPPEEAPQPIPAPASPAQGNRPIKSSVGYQDGPTVSWAVYAQGPLDPHTLGVGHIRALVWDFARSSNEWALDRFTFLDIEQIQPADAFDLAGQLPSWRIKLDMYREGGLQPRAKAGLGWSHSSTDWSATTYADLVLTQKGLQLNPALSLTHRSQKTQTIVEVSADGQHEAALQYQVNQVYFLGFKYDKRKGDSLGLSMGRYW
jgi:hypothetical protein